VDTVPDGGELVHVAGLRSGQDYGAGGKIGKRVNSR